MINIAEKGYFKADITEFKDFIDDGTTFKLEIKESAGNVLPLLILDIDLPPQLMDYVINEGVNLDITIGADQDSSKDSSWKFYNWEINKGSLSAILGMKRDYVNDNNIEVINDSSVNTIKTVASRYFNYEDNGLFYGDKMKWINPNISSRDFINEIWLHSYKENSLIIPAIMSDNTFILKNIMDKKDTFRISKNEEESDFPLIIQYDFSSNSGTINNSVGLIKERTHNISDSTVKVEPMEINPIFGQTFNRSGYRENHQNTSIMSDNVHENYFKAKSYNLSHLASLGNFGKKITVGDLYGIKLLDTVDLITPYDGFVEASETQSGTYIVTDIFTKIDENKRFSREIVIRKDAVTVDALQGEFI